MTAAHPVHGLWCALLTPLDASGGVDHDLLVAHARSLQRQGVDGVAPFGTTGEGQSFSVAERVAGVEALLTAGGSPGWGVGAARWPPLSGTNRPPRRGVETRGGGRPAPRPAFSEGRRQ